MKRTGRSLSLDDDSPDEALPDIDDFATSKPEDKGPEDREPEDREKDEEPDSE